MGKISKLTPILYKENETDFNHNGLGQLHGLLVNHVEEVLNGEFEAYFELPAEHELADKITEKAIIKAKPNRKDNSTVFRVYDYEIDTVSGNLLIYARHKNIDDLNSNLILDVNINNRTPEQAWNTAKNNAKGLVETTFSSNVDTRSSTHWQRQSLLSAVAGKEGSMIQHWGGEIKHGNNWLWLYRRRGEDNVTTIRHGKNLAGLQVKYSTRGLVTAIVPYHNYHDEDESEDGIDIYGDVVESKHVDNYPHVYHEIVEYTHTDLGFKVGEKPTKQERIAALNNKAKTWFGGSNNRDLPSINITVQLEDLSQTKEYEDFKDFEQIEIGDTVTVYSKRFGVKLTAKVRRVVYDGNLERNVEVELGQAARSIYDDYKDLVDNRVDKVEYELKEGIDHVLISANGKNKNYFGTADPNEVELNGQDGDIYFRTNGQKQELWIFKDGQWSLEVSDLTGEEIRFKVEQALEEAESARTEATEAKQQVEQVVDDAIAGAESIVEAKDVEYQQKFDDAQSEINQVSNKANEAVGQIDGMLLESGLSSLGEVMTEVIASFGNINKDTSKLFDDVDEAIGKAENALSGVDGVVTNLSGLETTVDNLTGEVQVKANKSELDALEGTVTTQGTQIGLNTNKISAKADKSYVDTVKGTVEDNTAELAIQADEISKRLKTTTFDTQMGTVNSKINQTIDTVDSHTSTIATLRTDVDGKATISQFNTLESTVDGTVRRIGDAEGNIAQLTNTSNSLVSRIESVEDWEIGGRNLLTGTSNEWRDMTWSNWNSYPNHSISNSTVNVDPNTYYTFSVDYKDVNTSDGVSIGVRIFWELENGSRQETANGQTAVAKGKSGKAHITVKSPSNAIKGTAVLRKYSSGGGASAKYRNEKLEKGNKATDWSPAPEDMATQSQYSQLSTAINLRVQKGDVLSQINVEANRTLIQTNKLYLDADTVSFSGKAFIPSANIIELTANKITGTTAQFTTLRSKVITANTITASHIQSDNALIDKIFATQALVDRLISKSIFTNALTSRKIITDGMIAANAQIDGAKIADATIASAKIANIDAGKIVTGNLVADNGRFQLNMNTGKVVMYDAELEGRVTAISGRIGGWEMRNDGLSAELATNRYSVLKSSGDVVFAVGSPERHSTSGARLQIRDNGQFNFSRNGLNSNFMLINEGFRIRTDDRLYLYGSSGIFSENAIRPLNTNEYNLGGSSYRWRNIYLTNNPNVSSDARLKKDIQALPKDLIKYIAKHVKPKQYTMYGKTHVGYIAQDVRRALKEYARTKVTESEVNEYIKRFDFLQEDGDLSLTYAEIAVLKDEEQNLRIKQLEKRIEELENAS